MSNSNHKNQIDLAHCRDAAALLGESHDCVVRACAVALQLPYSTMHNYMAASGRRAGCGFSTVAWKQTLTELGVQLIRHEVRSRTVRSLKYDLDVMLGGTWLVETSNHVLCVRNGEIHDWADGRQLRILFVWRVDTTNFQPPINLGDLL